MERLTRTPTCFRCFGTYEKEIRPVERANVAMKKSPSKYDFFLTIISFSKFGYVGILRVPFAILETGQISIYLCEIVNSIDRGKISFFVSILCFTFPGPSVYLYI